MASDQEMRDWARANGYSVGERGRLPQSIIYAWNKAHLTNNAEVKTVTMTEIPSDYCQECYTDSPKHHASCSLYVAPAVLVPVADAVVPAAPEPPVANPGDQEATITALIRSIAATAVTQAPQTIDRAEVETIAVEVFETLKDTIVPRQISVRVNDDKVRTIDGLVHHRFDEVLHLLGAGDNVYLVGPAGTGKSTLAKQCAEALDVPFYTISCDSQMSSTALKGYRDANGNYVGTDYRKGYGDGGVFLLDEADQSHPSPLTWLNMSLENGHCAFPDGYITRNPNFYVIVGANTYGTGATAEYVGANKQNAAFLDRFSFVDMPIDEKLEELATFAELPGNPVLAREWLDKVRGWRKNAEEQNIRVLITPRASIKGARLLATGNFTMERVAELRVWKNVDATTRAKIERGV